MSDRPFHRGGRGGGDRGGGSGGYRGGRGGGRGGGAGGGASGAGSAQTERPKKENILDLAKYMDKAIIVKFNGGREVRGTLKGYDALMNLVLDEVQETLRGLVVVRGTLLVLISPADGSEEIPNPFGAPADE
ncbi:U6 snRNA-associated Sm-like protein LSm7 [Trichoderma asperellum]|uniref:U6 snRNA-associated Sm-like protein LSm7 n=1 Tax=Trichoderma asperellum TaxID=101201 RepID=A0A6V8QMM7_TRIAP|nr:U6 snRNA-associated Sm-like protein LSm7 [Trichoderma asperellum]